MRTKKTLAILALLMTLAMLLSACGKTEAPAPEQPAETQEAAAGEPAAETGETGETAEAPAAAAGVSDETLRVVITGEPVNIMPLSAESGEGHWIDWVIYDRLVNYDSDTGALVPGLAESWEWIDDTHIRFHLRQDAVAYDGSTITADDVMFSLQCGLSGDANTQWSSVDGDECSVEDEYTVVIGLKEVYPSIVGKLSYVAMLTILDESSVEALGGYEAAIRNPKCTSGAYFFDEWKEGEYIRVVRNDNYWGEPGYYKTIEFTWIEDSTARTMAVASGDSDVAVEIGSADLLAVDTYDNCKSYTVGGGGTNVIFFNTTNEYLSNAKVREAIAYAVDADYCAMVATNGTSPVADSVIPSVSSYYKAPEAGYDRSVDIEKAKSLLTEAGYPDGFELYMPCVGPTAAVSEAVQANLREIGITVNVEICEIPVFLGATDAGNFDLVVQPTFSDDIVNYTKYFDNRLELNARGGGIVGGDEALYPIIDRCKYSTDEADNQAAWGELQDFVRDNDLCVPLYETTIFYCMDGDYSYKYFSNGHINMATLRPAA